MSAKIYTYGWDEYRDQGPMTLEEVKDHLHCDFEDYDDPDSTVGLDILEASTFEELEAILALNPPQANPDQTGIFIARI